MSDEALLQDIRRQISLTGPMDVGTYMTLCLAHPHNGYYATRDPFGPQGDFTTAPEISQLFGDMIGLWVADLITQMGSPDVWYLVELGPGRGTLMSDVLRILGKVPDLKHGAQIHLVETSPVLRDRQAHSLAPQAVRWHDDLTTLPTDAPLIVIANEFFDALPVQQLIRQGEGFDEIVVGIDPVGQGLTFGRVPFRERLNPSTLPEVPDGSVIEYAPVRLDYAQTLFDRIRNQGGAALIVDYGYDVPVFTSTLQAVRAHKKVSPLETPGHADVTALVNFSELAACAYASGLRAHGPIGQGDFLIALGVMSWAENVMAQADPRQQADVQSGLTRLIDPDQMGTLFKVLAVHAPAPTIFPAGFAT